MRDGFKSLIASAVVAAAPILAVAQVNLQPTPAPAVTAEDRPWFLAREPVVFAGSLYYPSGPQVYFNRFEMIRSGYYDWVPLYTRTTLEPYSILFVPVAGGLMQPYERRRSGELAGTAGSTAPGFPIDRPAGIATSVQESSGIPQAAGPPTGLGPSIPFPASSLGMVQPAPVADARVATTGTASPAPSGALRSAARPEGLNGVFVEYDGRRWFNRGAAVSFDPAAFVASGTHRGATVYMKRGDTTTIYIPVAESVGAVTPYSLQSIVRR
jgi:hypothetical protein